MAIQVKLAASVGASLAVEPGVLHHAIDIAASGSNPSPVQPEAVASQFQLADALVRLRQGITLDPRIQTAVAQVHPSLLMRTLSVGIGVKILAHSEAIDIPLQAWVDGATPLLMQVSGIRLPPTAGLHTLITLALMQCAHR